MSEQSIPKQPLVDNLVSEWAAIDELLAGLGEDAWSRPSVLPGWSVQDIVSHIIGTECVLAGDEAPAVGDAVAEAAHVHNEIGKVNEAWVESLRAQAPEKVRQRFRDITASRRAVLEAMAQEDFDAPSWTPAGHGTYARFMQIRLFDCWMHEQDIRDTVGVPGHESGPCAEAAVDEIVRALGYIVGKRAGAPRGSTVTFELTGPVRRTLHVEVGERAHLVERLDGPATARLALPSSLFTRLAGGRVAPEDHLDRVTLGGDTELATALARNLAYTI